jgi:hypothetical protein
MVALGKHRLEDRRIWEDNIKMGIREVNLKDEK